MQVEIRQGHFPWPLPAWRDCYTRKIARELIHLPKYHAQKGHSRTQKAGHCQTSKARQQTHACQGIQAGVLAC